MPTFFTSDLHFGHANIIRYCNRPFGSVREMDSRLVELWNETVGPDDHVWVLGDVAMGDVGRGLARVRYLNGTKHLVAGNHDKVFRRTGAVQPDWEQRYRDSGFASLHHGELVRPARHFGIDVDGDVRLCHFPYQGDSRANDRYVDHRPGDDGITLLHGHTHGRWRHQARATGTVQIDVGVDAWSYRPVAAAEISTLLDPAYPMTDHG